MLRHLSYIWSEQHSTFIRHCTWDISVSSVSLRDSKHSFPSVHQRSGILDDSACISSLSHISESRYSGERLNLIDLQMLPFALSCIEFDWIWRLLLNSTQLWKIFLHYVQCFPVVRSRRFSNAVGLPRIIVFKQIVSQCSFMTCYGAPANTLSGFWPKQESQMTFPFPHCFSRIGCLTSSMQAGHSTGDLEARREI